MNTPLIYMNEEVAKEKVRAYRSRLGQMKGKAVSAEVQKEYEAILAGYRALAKGTPLLDLDEVMATCGFDDKGRPKLAICRANRECVKFEWRDGSHCRFTPADPRMTWSRQEADRREVLLSRPGKATYRTEYGLNSYYGYARVPLIPADVRPPHGTEKDWFVLWEVEKWADERREIMVDRDPYLLKHLGGSLYAVIAEWDLTELERAVMKGNLAR